MITGSINPNYNFNEFLVGSCNQFAHAAALAVANNPGGAYNPLYLYGGCFEESKFLLHAIGNEIERKNNKMHILYTTGESFNNEFLVATQLGSLNEFRKKHRNIDVLLLQDVQFLAGKERAMEEFMHSFDAVYHARKQIVISGNAFPNKIPTFKEDLYSRLEWGLIADISPADIETRIAFIQIIARRRRIKITESATLFIADKFEDPNLLQYYNDILFELASFTPSRTAHIDLGLVKKQIKKINKKIINEISLRDLKKQVQIVDSSYEILELVREDFSNIYKLSPESFELFICDRLAHMKLVVKQVKSTYAPDGGIDIVAWPTEEISFPFLLAVQVKHHKYPSRKTGSEAVRDFKGALASHPFQAGLLVTNTAFTPDARWFASNMPNIIRLRDFKDLKRWIWDNFTDWEEWREIPTEIELAPGIIVKIPIIK